MRIVYVLTSLGMGGAERQVVVLASRMAGRGHTVALMVLRPLVPEQWPTELRVVHLEMRKNPASVLAAIARGHSFLAEFKPDLVHSHTFHANIAARLLKVTLPALPVLCTVHNVYEGGWGRMLAYRLTGGMSRLTTAVSQAAADRFVHLKAVSRGKCIVVPNGIDTDEFLPSAERRERTRAAMGVEHEFIWLTAGRMVPAKDYPNLLRAFRRVVEARPDARLWIAGEASGTKANLVQTLAAELGLDEQATEKGGIFNRGGKQGLKPNDEFKAFAARLKSCPVTKHFNDLAKPSVSAASEAVRWLGLRRDMPALLDAADGFVLGSAWEGMPLAVGEAMAMEKLVVATDVGGVRELVGDAGVMAPFKDPEALAEAMLDMMRLSPEERHTVGCAARERILRDFNMDARTEEWEALYLKITADL